MENFPGSRLRCTRTKIRDAPEMLGFWLMEKHGMCVCCTSCGWHYLLERLGFCGDGGNGEWRRYRWARIQDPESPGTGWVKLAMELSNAAWLTAMELGKIQDKLSSRERSIIKLLPPCLAWLKCHAF